VTSSEKFGGPGSDQTVHRIDLNEALIRHPEATFMMRASGAAMHDFGIDDRDVLVVDRAISAVNGHVVIAVVEGEHVCRQLQQRDGAVNLKGSEGIADIRINEETPLVVFGVVTTVIKQLRV